MEATVEGIEKFLQTIVTEGDIRGDGGVGAAAGKTWKDGEGSGR
jgi:hypothetical protein